MNLTGWLGRGMGNLVGEYQARVKALSVGQTMGLSSVQMLQGQRSPTPVASMADAARFATSDDVYAAVTLLAENAATVPLKVYVNDEEAPDHDLQLLLERGNRDQGPDWAQWAYSWLWLAGEAFIYVRHAGGAYAGLPTELCPMSGERWIVRAAGPQAPMAREYLYLPPGRDASSGILTAPGEVCQSYLFNPLDPLRGLSPLSSLRLGLDAERASNSANRDLFANGMMIDSIISAPGLQPAQSERLQADMRAKHIGNGKRHGTLVINTDVSVEPMSLTPRDAEFIELQKMTTRDVAKAYQIPPMFLGDMSDATYSNYDTAWQALWELAIMPKVRRLASSLTQALSWQYADAPVIRPDISNLSALQANAKEQAETVKLLKDAGWEPEQAAKFVYGEEVVCDVEWPEAPETPPALATAGQPVAPPPADDEEDSPAKAERVKADKRDRYTMLIAAQEALLPAAQREVGEALKTQGRAVLDAVDRLDSSKADTSAIAVNLENAVDGEPLMSSLVKVWDSACKGGASATATVGGLELRTGRVDQHTAAFIRDTAARRVVLVNDNTKALLREAVDTAYANGEGIAGVRTRVEAAFGLSDEPDAINLYTGRVDNIAATESSRAFGEGSMFAMKDAGAEWHEWQSSHLPNSRHGGVDGQVRRVGEHFDVRGYPGRYPSAEELPPSEACRCKCCTIPVDPPQGAQS